MQRSVELDELVVLMGDGVEERHGTRAMPHSPFSIYPIVTPPQSTRNYIDCELIQSLVVQIDEFQTAAVEHLFGRAWQMGHANQAHKPSTFAARVGASSSQPSKRTAQVANSREER